MKEVPKQFPKAIFLHRKLYTNDALKTVFYKKVFTAAAASTIVASSISQTETLIFNGYQIDIIASFYYYASML